MAKLVITRWYLLPWDGAGPCLWIQYDPVRLAPGHSASLCPKVTGPAQGTPAVVRFGACLFLWTQWYHLVGGLEHEFYDFPFSCECHHPDWRTPSFFRGVGWNHQPVTVSWLSKFHRVSCCWCHRQVFSWHIWDETPSWLSHTFFKGVAQPLNGLEKKGKFPEIPMFPGKIHGFQWKIFP